jgi:hypothetical protein
MGRHVYFEQTAETGCQGGQGSPRAVASSEEEEEEEEEEGIYIYIYIYIFPPHPADRPY